MNGRVKQAAALAFALVLMLVGTNVLHAAPLPPLHRVNAPYFNGDIQFEQTAVFWFGKVTSIENYADVRIGYNSTELFVHVTMFDRWLWYDESPTSTTLTDWDSVTLYLNKDGSIGNVPGTNSYRFDGQLTWWENPRTPWQTAYRGNGSGWVNSTISFTTDAGWRGTAPNDNTEDNRGWWLSYRIPFSSLGLSGPPSQGTLWGLSLVVHDRDNAAGSPPIADETWPESMAPNQPGTWGQLRFGLSPFIPQPAIPRGTVTIRQGVDSAVVPDTAVGGTVGNMCPGNSDYIWNQWADFKDPHGMQFNVQNQGDVSDWPCFAKYLVTFPLSTVPFGKVIISATLTLHQFGNAGQGWNPPPEPSYLQVLTIGQDWNEETLTWNTVPVARENVAGASVDPLPGYGGDPGVPRTWDVSRAVAEVYAAGEPLRLAVYSADWAYHSGRYFWSSDHDDYHPEARPTLTLMWGEAAATVYNQVHPVAPAFGQQVTYTLSLLGSGRPLTFTDNLPPQVSDPGTIRIEGGGVPGYDGPARRLMWTGAPTFGQPVTLTFPVTVAAHGPLLIGNTAILTDAIGSVSIGTASFIVDARQIWLPLILR